MAGTLCAAGLPLAVVNPRQIRDFARATGRLATDALDARSSPTSRTRSGPNPAAPDAQARTLGELVTRRRQIRDDGGRTRPAKADLAPHDERRPAAPSSPTSKRTSTIRGTPAWRETEDLLKSVPGVGDVTPAPSSHPRSQEDLVGVATGTAARRSAHLGRPRQGSRAGRPVASRHGVGASTNACWPAGKRRAQPPSCESWLTILNAIVQSWHTTQTRQSLSLSLSP